MAERNDRPQRARRPKRKVCMFCVDKIENIDYKDTAKLRRYVSERGNTLIPLADALAFSLCGEKFTDFTYSFDCGIGNLDGKWYEW